MTSPSVNILSLQGGFRKLMFQGDTFAVQLSPTSICKNTTNTAEYAAAAARLSNGFATVVKATKPRNNTMNPVMTPRRFHLTSVYASTPEVRELPHVELHHDLHMKIAPTTFAGRHVA